MQMIKESDLKVLFDKNQIQTAIEELGKKINQVY